MSTFARYLGNQPPPTDGTEGTTSIKLTLKDENEPLVLNGCFIHNDENLWKLINDYNYITKHKDTKYFTYFCCFYENLKNHLLKTEIIFHLHRLYKEDLDKSWPIIQGEDNAFFLHGGCHVFLPACHEDLVREKKVKKFLKIHSKPILYKTHEIVSGKYKGLAKVNGSIKFVEIAMTSCTNGLVLSNNIFQKLVNGPLMYSDKVVGYYYKNPDGSKITVYMLATRDSIDVWKASAINKEQLAPINQQTQTRASGVTQSTQQGTSGATQQTQGGTSFVTHPTQHGASDVTHPTQHGASGVTHPTQQGPSGVTHQNQQGPSGVTLPNQHGASGVTHPTQQGPSGVTHPTQQGTSGVTLQNQQGPSGVTLPNQHGASDVTHPTQQGAPGVTQPTQQGASGVTLPTEQGASGVTQPTEQGASGVTQPTQQGASGVTQPTQQGASGVTQPTQQGSSGVTQPTQQGASGVTQPTQQGASGVTQLSQQGASGVTQPTQQGASGVTQSINTASITITGVVKHVTAAGTLLVWSAGSVYILHRYQDDPDTMIRLLHDAIFPGALLTGGLIRELLRGCFKILIEIQ